MKKTMMYAMMIMMLATMAIAQLPSAIPITSFAMMTNAQIANEMTATLAETEISWSGITYIFYSNVFMRHDDSVEIASIPNIRITIQRNSILKCIASAETNACLNDLIMPSMASSTFFGFDRSLIGQVRRQLESNYDRTISLRDKAAEEMANNAQYNAFAVSSQQSIAVINMVTTTTRVQVTTTTKLPQTTTTITGAG